MKDQARAVITGASSGIGVALARHFAKCGHDLVLVARRELRLRALAGELTDRHHINVDCLPLDLSRPDSAAKLHARATEGDRQVDILVNNAGFGWVGAATDIDIERQSEMIRLNISTLAESSHRFLPAMIRRGSGRILNVASTAAFQPGPRMAVYFATKAFVLSFTEGLAEELRGSGVSATALCPGPVHTEFGDVAGFPTSKVVARLSMPARRVARAGYLGMQRGRAVVVPGIVNKFGILVQRVAPRWLVRRAMGNFLRAVR
jgi:short-subunit dehydrogenase